MRRDETRRRGARWRLACGSSLLGVLCVACFGLGDAVDLVSDRYVCGNDKAEPYEECDDGNERSGDGCSRDCELESGWVCSDRRHCERKRRPSAPVMAADGGATDDAGGDAGSDAALRDAAR
jgi:cysteine-rich repeat protein